MRGTYSQNLHINKFRNNAPKVTVFFQKCKIKYFTKNHHLKFGLRKIRRLERFCWLVVAFSRPKSVDTLAWYYLSCWATSKDCMLCGLHVSGSMTQATFLLIKYRWRILFCISYILSYFDSQKRLSVCFKQRSKRNSLTTHVGMVFCMHYLVQVYS